jgi:streptogramin lyase
MTFVPPLKTLQQFFVGAMVLTLGVLTVGCGTGPVATEATSNVALSGRMVGGQQAINGASIYLYAAGSTAGGNGTGATNLLTKTVLTNPDGSFSITGDYTCPSASTQVYLVGSGGNPGLGTGTNNTASLMMAPLGDCGNLSASSFIYIDEVTTAASAWALSQFLGPNANIGSSATNANGLRNAFLVANNLVNTTTGLAGGTALPAGATIEAAKLYTLANVLSACVNTAGGSACSPLFTAATVGGVVPSNTLDAALAIVRNPGINVTGVYNAAVPASPFQPVLPRAPKDWTMSITYTGGGLNLPTDIAMDSTGSVWVANYNGTSTATYTASKFSANGIPASATGFSDPNLYENYGIAVDTQDNAWITNEESYYTINNGFGSLSKFSSSGTLLSGTGLTNSIYYPYAIAADNNGDIWVADNGHSQASYLANDGSSLAGPNGYSSSLLPLPVAVAIDGSHNAWFAGEGYATKVTPAGVMSEYQCCRVVSAIAIDQNQAVWVADYSASAVVQLSPAGAVWQTVTSGGIYYPENLAIDGKGSVWTANYHGNSISGFATATGGASSAALSPSYGFGLDAGLASPFGIALDASGNVWVANFAGNTLTTFVGLAAPVKTPLLGPPVQP